MSFYHNGPSFGVTPPLDRDAESQFAFNLYAYYNDMADRVEAGEDINDLPLTDGDKEEVMEVLEHRGY